MIKPEADRRFMLRLLSVILTATTAGNGKCTERGDKRYLSYTSDA